MRDKNGKPVSDAAVALAFYMPPMPTMQMPAMRNTVKLTSAGHGVCRGARSRRRPGRADLMQEMHGTYASTNTCAEPFDHGQMSLTKR